MIIISTAVSGTVSLVLNNFGIRNSEIPTEASFPYKDMSDWTEKGAQLYKF